MGTRELEGIAGPLYALPYGEFVAARTAAAKDVSAVGLTAAGQRALAAEVRALPKPSVAAWAVNMLAAHNPEILRELAGLGTSMQAAQDALDAVDLRRLAQQRRQLLAGAVKTAHALAAQQGRAISAAVATEVEQTLRAATADPGAAAAVQSGCLLRALSADGVDVVDLAGAVAVPGSHAAAVTGTGTARETAAVRGTEPVTGARGTEPAARAAHRGEGAGGKPTEQPRLRAVGKARATPTPSAVERARAGLEAAEEAAAEADGEARRAAAELAEATAESTRLADEARELRRRLDVVEAELKGARKRHELSAALAQQSARAADRQRRKEVLARERVLRLGNTPEG
ncbi:hypothetical protein [Arthrobacter sp. ok362]|uniref:hypothetical protein n=1 Tax=Arthrobacter sp. ok362 TaxID=1761745 RepID=UPI00088DEFA7|nr:hypothetical protein [Arthrobacter sp. ok362]SDL30868.1 hypothetical protein SAMN04487913_10838 [Arthrobacter sp. ok362]